MRLLLPMLLVSLLGACSTPTLQEQPSAEFADLPQPLYPVDYSGFEQAHVARDAKFANYRRISNAPLSLGAVEITQTTVSGTVRRDWMITPERERNLGRAWKGSMQRAFADYKWVSSQQTGQTEEGVLRIAASLTRVRPRRSVATSTAASGSPIQGTGDTVDISMEIRLYDGEEGALLGVIRDTRTIASIQWSRAAGADMVGLFNSWSSLLHTRISGH